MTVWLDEDRGRWRFDFQIAGVRHARECLGPDGHPVTSRRAALDAEAEAKRQARVTSKLAAAGELTVAQVFDALADGWQRGPGWKDRGSMVRELLEFFGPATAMRAIDGAKLQDYVTFALSQPVRIWCGGPSKTPGNLVKAWKDSGRTRSPARVNRYLPLLRAAFQRAYNTRDPRTGQRAIDEVPAIVDLDETKKKARPVPESVLSRLYDILPAHVIDAMVLTLCFGFRRGEAFTLQTHQVDWQAEGIRLMGEDVKDAEDAFLPVSQFAIGYLRCLAIEADAGARAI
jgi:integrase